MNETSGVLKPAVMAYLDGGPMTDEQIAVMRAYLRIWMDGPWIGPDIGRLRASIDFITTRAALEEWLDLALDSAIDPL